jgi:uncharacterized protein (TIGR03067 family)
MTRFNGLIAAAVLVAAAGGVWAEDKKEPAKAEPAKFDATKLEGKWMITEMTKYGEKVDTKDMKDPAVFTKDTITMKASLGEFAFKYTVDAKADPVGIDMEITAPEGFKGGKAKGIIKLDGDKLTLTYDSDPESKARPDKFESKKDTKVLSYVLTRAKEEKKEEKKDK